MTSNPLLQPSELPQFSQIKPEHVEPAITEILQKNRAMIDTLLEQEAFTWESLVTPLQEIENVLDEAWSPVRHLNCVMSEEALRKAHDTCLEKISDYATDLGQNEKLYQAYLSLQEGPEYATYSDAQKKLLELTLRDFRLSGVALPADQKKRFKEIQQQLSKLQSTFENNLLDATDAWSIHITDEKEISGIPEHALAAAQHLAESKGKAGWIFNLEFPSYSAVITYADSPELREKIYYAYSTRASDLSDPKWDNTTIIDKILALRKEEAELLGFDHYAALSLAPKMAKQPAEVMEFLNELAQRSKHFARDEFAELRDFARTDCNLEQVHPWDISYVSEKLQHHRYDISREKLRPYFPEKKVIEGLFAVTQRLFGISFKLVTDFDAWHDSVKLYEVYDEAGQLRGKVYMDLYARPGKRGGAWMDQCHSRYRKADGSINVPIAFLTCNFAGPGKTTPALLTHDEVNTLFHEFGHVLQGILTLVDYSDIAGTAHVAWDAVELPSQFLENWCWEEEALNLISEHFETKEPIPAELFQKMIAAKNFHAGMYMVRQIEFSLFDFRLHMEYDAKLKNQTQHILDEVRSDIAAYKVPATNRFQHSFSHIFAGGYAAGYYSYKWAEVLSADAFSKFEENGIFDKTTGREFLHAILETGGSIDAADAFHQFRGRAPKIDALLRHSGLKD